MYQLTQNDPLNWTLGPWNQWSSTTNYLTNKAQPQDAAWPSANLAIYVPFYLRAPMVLGSIWIMNGATVSGNQDLGIYTESGTNIISSGSVASAGTSAPQRFVLTTPIALNRGRYWLAAAKNDGTGTHFAWNTASTFVSRMLGCAQQATAFALPATATFATTGQIYLPLIGIQPLDALIAL